MLSKWGCEYGHKEALAADINSGAISIELVFKAMELVPWGEKTSREERQAQD